MNSYSERFTTLLEDFDKELASKNTAEELVNFAIETTADLSCSYLGFYAVNILSTRFPTDNISFAKYTKYVDEIARIFREENKGKKVMVKIPTMLGPVSGRGGF